jgi:hypothetical protein
MRMTRIDRIALAATFLAAVLVALPRPTAARPQYAAREGLQCLSCHVDPSGGGLRNGNGFSYQRGRHAFDVEPKFEEWTAEPEIAKGVRIGADLRYVGMSFDTSPHDGDAPDPETPTTFAKYAMQGAAYLALMPVEQLVIYYTHDVAAGAQKQRDWWGMIRGLTSANLYVKAGQIRPPYGIRFEDHSPFVRGRLDGPPGETGIMDVDPRFSHPGVEVGLVKNRVFAHVAWQDPNGTFSPGFTRLGEKMIGGRAGVQFDNLIVGASARRNGLADANDDTRSTRYGAYALFGRKSFALSAEVDAGEDEESADAKTLVQGAFLGGEVYVSRGVTVRGEFNYMDVEDDLTEVVTRVSRRYGAGVEWSPIPFLRLTAEARKVSNSNPANSAMDEFWTLGYGVFSF